MRAAWLLLVLVLGCSRKEGETCGRDGRCADGLACLNDRCARCDGSDRCRLYGQCGATDQRCAVPADTEAGCTAAHGSDAYIPCEHDGLCGAVNGFCAARSSEDCRRGRLCKTDGACAAENGRCVAKTAEDCRSAALCLEVGQCTPKDGACVMSSDEDCAQARPCAQIGKCTFRNGACVVTRDEECQKSALCTAHGRCTARGGECISTKP